MARFAHTLSDEQALKQLGQVARLASPDEPRKATQRAFDEARADHPELSSARALCQRFGLSWAQLLRAATAPPAQQTRQASYGRRDTSRKGITVEDCVDAIRRVAVKNKRKRLTRSDYQTLRDKMTSASGRSKAGARPSLPTLNQVDRILAKERVSWTQAVTQAGFNPRPEPRQPGKTRAKRWTPDEILAGLLRADQLLGPGERLTQRKLRELAKANPGQVPGWKAVHRACKLRDVGFAELKEEARHRMNI